MQRTDSRSLPARKASIVLRIAELRGHLAAAERAEAEIDTAIEMAEYAKERAAPAPESYAAE